MDLFDVVKACFRRWYVLLPMLLVTGWYAHNVYAAVKPVYYTKAIVGLAPPSYRLDQAVAGQPVPRNGLLDIGGAPLLANMTALAVREPTVVNRVVALGGLPDYSAKMFPTPPNTQAIPLVMIEETAPDPATASKTLEIVSNEISTGLESIQKQAAVPPEMMVNAFVVSPPSTPIAAMPTRTRATASIAVAGIGLTVLLTVSLDVLLVRRRQRNIQRALSPSDDGQSPAGDEQSPAENRASSRLQPEPMDQRNGVNDADRKPHVDGEEPRSSRSGVADAR